MYEVSQSRFEPNSVEQIPGDRHAHLPYQILIFIPIIWILGVDFFIYHLFAIYLFLKRPRKFAVNSYFDLTIWVGIFALLISSFINLFAENTDASRIFAAWNNIGLLIVGWAFFKVATSYDFSNPDSEKKARKISRNVYIFFFLSIALVLYYMLTKDEISVTTFFGFLSPKTDGLIGRFQSTEVLTKDLFYRIDVPRIALFSSFSTSAAMIVAMLTAISIGFKVLHPGMNLKTRRVFFLGAFGVVFTLARGAILGLVGWVVAAFLIWKLGRGAIFFLAALVVCAGAFLSVNSSYIDEFQNARPGSSNTREEMYVASFSMVLDNNPLIGLGVKPRTDDFAIPIGSHSTLLSLFVRGGVLALVPFFIALVLCPIIWTLSVAHRPWRSSNRLDVGLFLGATSNYLMFLAFQDLDAYPTVTICTFVYLGILRKICVSSRQ
jgi:hypothetical protein